MRITTPSDRVQVISRGQLKPPGACALCGNGTCEEGYVDSGVYFDWEGHVYFCMNCTVQIAETIGCLTPAESDHLKSLNESIAEELSKTQEKLNHAESRLADYDRVLSGLVPSIANVDGSLVEESQPESDVVDEPDSNGAESDTKPTESVEKRRPANPKRAPVRNASFEV